MNCEAFDDPYGQAQPPGAEVADWELAAARYELAMLTADDAARGTMPPALAAEIAGKAVRFLPRPRSAVRRRGSASWQGLSVGGSLVTLAAATVAALLAVVFAWWTWTDLGDKPPTGGLARPTGTAPAGSSGAAPCQCP